MILYDIISEIFSNKDSHEWNYYQMHFSSDPIKNPKHSLEFINEYFSYGRKDFAFFVNMHDTIHLSEDRAIHTVSAFFIGLFLERNICANNSFSIQKNDKRFPFSYLWFLTCLYHDFGYCIEENHQDYPITLYERPLHLDNTNPIHSNFRNDYKYLSILKHKLDITCSVYSTFRFDRNIASKKYDPMWLKALETANRPHSRVIEFDNGIRVKGCTYNSRLVAKYFNYCSNELYFPVNNHGIVGGFLFFDRMIKNYVQKYQEFSIQEDTRGSFYDFYSEGKHFFIELIPVFSYISDCIIAHNIWIADKESYEIYKSYGMFSLLPENFKKISFQSNPLLYILAIVDSLEPYKTYREKLSAEEIWKSIDLSYDSRKYQLNISILDPRLPPTELINKISTLNTWTEISTEEYSHQAENDSIILKFH